jgi:four helix bundle protein
VDYFISDKDGTFIVRDKSGEYEIDLSERIFRFVVRVVKYVKSFERSAVNYIVISQLTKSATSIGANYEEAQGASSRDEFAYKVGISRR